jgi:predicted peptidase
MIGRRGAKRHGKLLKINWALCDIPIWVFHGGEDSDVLPFQSEVSVDALKNCDGNIRFTFYADSDHAGSWTRAYADTELYQWLLAQTLN